MSEGGEFSPPSVISQSQGALQKVWVKLISMFVEQFSSPWYKRVGNSPGYIGHRHLMLCGVVLWAFV